jgi:hypothetical protein
MVMNLKRILMFFFLAAVLCSCGTAARIVMMKPAEVNMAGARRIAILDFSYPQNHSKALTFQDAWTNAMERSFGIKKFNKESLQERIAYYATDEMVLTLANTGYFEVIKPEDVSNAVAGSDKSTADPIVIGQIVGAQAIIVGDISDMGKDDSTVERTIKQKDKDGNEYEQTVYYYKRTLSIKLTYRAVNTSSGVIMATKTVSDSKTDEIEYENKNNLRDAELVYQDMVRDMLPIIARQIAPYKVTEFRSLVGDETKNPLMEKADKFVQQELYDDALKIYISVWKETKNPAAGINGAIMYEAVGDVDNAISLAKEVSNATANERAMEEYKRLLNVKAEQEEVRKQMQNDTKDVKGVKEEVKKQMQSD